MKLNWKEDEHIEKTPGGPVWDVRPPKKSVWVRLMQLLSSLLAVGVLVVGISAAWENRPTQLAVAVATARPTMTPAPQEPEPEEAEEEATEEPTEEPKKASTGSGTPKPMTPEEVEKMLKDLGITQEKLDLLNKTVTTEVKDVTYDSAEDYFGDDAGGGSLPPPPPPTAVPTAVPTATPAPTPEPTPEPTPVPTPEPTEVPTEVPTDATESEEGDTGESEESEAPPAVVPTQAPTEAPTAAPTEAPTQAPTAEPVATAVPDGPVLQGTGSSDLIRRYNAWDTDLKQYAWQMAKYYNVSYEMVVAIIYNESRFVPGLTHTNSNGTVDWGLMQVNDVCLSLLNRQLGIQSMEELLDPYVSIKAGCFVLGYHRRYVSNDEDALLRYQVGAGNYAYYKENGLVPKTYTITIGWRDQLIAAGI